VIPGAALALVLTASQIQWVNVAIRLGEPYGLGYTLAALEGQESSYCKFKRNDWSVGCLGTKRATVRSIFDPAATRARLESDNDYSLRAGLTILLYCRAATNSWRREIACYHWGEPHESKMSDAEIDSDGYVKAVSERVRQLQQIPVDTK
jgi:hypothetical protein